MSLFFCVSVSLSLSPPVFLSPCLSVSLSVLPFKYCFLSRLSLFYFLLANLSWRIFVLMLVVCVFFSQEKSHWHLAADQRSVGKDVSPHACAMPQPLLALLCLACFSLESSRARPPSLFSRHVVPHVTSPPSVPSDRASSPLLGLPLPHPCPPVTPCKHTQKFTSLRSQQNFGQSADVWPPNSWCIEKCHRVIRVK